MFKFLKKRIKKFEDKLEQELEHELQKKEQHSSQEPPLKSAETTTIQHDSPLVEVKKDENKKPSKPQVLTPRERRRRRVKAKKQRDETTDKQIEESLKAELERTYETRKSISKTIQTDSMSGKKISDEKLDDLLWELEIGLLESDVAYSVIESIKKDIKDELRKVPIKRDNINETVENVLRHAISHVLESNRFNFDVFLKQKEKPVVIMFVGVNGSGKTLSIAKMATLLKNKGYSSVMAAGDTFRAGAIEQLGIHAQKVGVKLVKHGAGADPAAVAFDAIEHAKAKHKDVVLLDTAGRMQTNVNLMDEMAKIKRVAKPDLILFVGDALSGNDAVEQAKRFNEVVGIDGVILTKVDTDAKGGSALSVAYTIGKPLLFIGVGQKYDEQIPFDAKWMISNIFDKS
ncbi:MAG: signal recognition particle-docking protein FtsY [Candidatus Thermoplasmatota archaeon]|nr:signal recognition particle-docking protein FtsY [Candidatus Thermoplasmatota archaeon]